MARLALNDADRQVRLWFVEQVKSLGCKVTVDKMGNIFAIRSGKNKDAPPTVAGSHLDTQPAGGRYDGILGVNAGLEMLRVLHENNVETEGSIGVVDWTKYYNFLTLAIDIGFLTRFAARRELGSL
jgi:acetylornithine deacetylase/succinyl-diaminopimelate desuccinylase-like protein